MKPLSYFTIVDRYFMRKFLFVAFAFIFIAGSLFLIFDILSKSEELGVLFQESTGKALLTLFQFYMLRTMNILLYTQYVFITASVAVTFFMLEKNSSMAVRGGEVIPLLTSGFSRKRVAIPFFIIGCLFILGMCTVEELFYTFCRDWPGANSNSLLGKIEIQEMTMRNDESTGLKIYGTDLDLENNSFKNPKIGVLKDQTFAQLDLITAEKAVWLPESDEHPAGFMLEKVVNLETKNWLTRASQIAVYIPHLNLRLPIFYVHETASWVPQGNIFIISVLCPEDLRKEKSMFLPESIPGLYKKISSKRQFFPHYKERIEFHTRVMRPFVESSLLFLLIPVILSARLRSKFKIFCCVVSLMGLNLSLIHIGKLLVLQEGIPACLGAWLPLLVLVPVCAFLFDELYT